MHIYIFIIVKAYFFWKGIQQFSFITEMLIQKNFKYLERMEVLITSHVKVFFGNKYKYNIYILLEMQK